MHPFLGIPMQPGLRYSFIQPGRGFLDLIRRADPTVRGILQGMRLGGRYKPAALHLLEKQSPVASAAEGSGRFFLRAIRKPRLRWCAKNGLPAPCSRKKRCRLNGFHLGMPVPESGVARPLVIKNTEHQTQRAGS